MLIAFVGVDGSGKTTIARHMVKQIERSGKKVIYFAPFRYVFLNQLLSLLRRLSGVTPGEKNQNIFLTTSRKSLLLQFWPLLALIDHWYLYLLRIMPLLWQGNYVICDRYFYDFAPSFLYYGYANKVTHWLYLRLLPRPVVTFFLSLPPGVARSRADDYDDDYFIIQCQRYEELASRLDWIRIDAEKSITTIVQKVVCVIK